MCLNRSDIDQMYLDLNGLKDPKNNTFLRYLLLQHPTKVLFLRSLLKRGLFLDPYHLQDPTKKYFFRILSVYNILKKYFFYELYCLSDPKTSTSLRILIMLKIPKKILS